MSSVVALFLLVGLVWMGSGVALIAAPVWWTGAMTRVLRDAVYRFVMTQLLILVGLILIIGTSSYQGHWLWVLLGSVAVVKGLFFLSAPERGRAALLQWWDRTPVWAHRASGVLMVAFAVLLALETIRTVS